MVFLPVAKLQPAFLLGELPSLSCGRRDWLHGFDAAAEMGYYVYILHSAELNRYYTGFSKYRGKRRRQHRREKKHWTAGADDWQEAFCTTVTTLAEARALEKKIKSRGAQRFLGDSRPTG